MYLTVHNSAMYHKSVYTISLDFSRGQYGFSFLSALLEMSFENCDVQCSVDMLLLCLATVLSVYLCVYAVLHDFQLAIVLPM